jgi:hypothetical protein
LSDSGSVVGGTIDASRVRQGFLYGEGAGMTVLPMREALAMNRQGTILGIGHSLSPVMLVNGQLVAMPGVAGFGRPSAFGMNNLNTVVGKMEPVSGSPITTSAFVWSESGGVLNLNQYIDPSSGWHLMGATGINDAGQIVGYGWYGTPEFFAYRGFLLTPIPEPSTWALCVLGVSVCLVARRRKTGLD